MKKNITFFFLFFALLGGAVDAQTSMTIPNGSFEQWSNHSGYSVTVVVLPVSIYSSYSTPSSWNYPAYPVNQSVTYAGMSVNINTSIPLIKASQETGSVPNGSKAVKLQTFMLSDIVNPTVLNLASGSIDPSLTQQVVPSILSTGVVNIDAFIPLLSTLTSGTGDLNSMIPTLLNEDVNDYITGGLALGDFRPGRLTGSYKYHSATSGDNGGVVLLGTHYNTSTHRREVVGGGVNLALTDINQYTSFEVEYLPLNELVPGSPNIAPDSLIVLLFSSAGNNRQQGSYICMDNLVLWSAPDTCADITTLTATPDIHESQLSWSVSDPADSFELEYGVAGFTPASGTTLTTTGNTISLTGLAASTTYEVHVRTLCSDTIYGDWSTVTFTTLGDTCTHITALSATADIHEAQLSWSTYSPASSYEIEYGVAGFTPASGTTLTTTGNTFSLTGLAASTTYEVHVRSHCSNAIYGDWSTVTFTTLGDTCSHITALSATADIHEAQLSWSVYSPVNSYEIEYGVVGFTPASATILTKTGNTLLLTGLTESTTYEVHVRSLCSNSIYGDWSTLQFNTLGDTCSHITALSATADIHEAQLSWSAYNPVNSYEIEYGVVGFTPASATILTTTGNTLLLTGLTESTTYEVHVRSLCSNSIYGDWSTLQFNTLGDTCTHITALSATADIHEAQLSWSSYSPVSSYEIEYGVAGFTPATGITLTTTEDTFLLTGLAASTDYEVHVRSRCSNTFLGDWSTVLFSTLDDTCASVLDLEINNTIYNDYAEAAIMWRGSSEPDHWEVEYGEQGFVLGEGTVVETNLPLFEINTSENEHTFRPNTLYDFYVRAVCSDSIYGDWDSIQYLTICAKVISPTLHSDSLTVTNDSLLSGFSISWTDTTDTRSWELLYRSLSDTLPTSLEVDTPWFEFPPLRPEETYTVEIYAHCGEDNYGDIVRVNFTTPEIEDNDTTVAIQTISQSSNPAITISPNPAQGQCMVTFADNTPAELRLYALDGRLIHIVATDGSPTVLTLPKEGVYLLHANTPTSSATYKIVNK